MSKKAKAVKAKVQTINEYDEISDDELREEMMEKESSEKDVHEEIKVNEPEPENDDIEEKDVEDMEVEEKKETTAYEKFMKDNSNKMDLTLINNKIQDILGCLL